MPKQPSNDEQRRNVDKKIAHATRPAIAYLAITEPFRDEGEWIFLGCTINDDNDGVSFNYGGTYIEAYLMRQIIVARLERAACSSSPLSPDAATSIISGPPSCAIVEADRLPLYRAGPL